MSGRSSRVPRDGTRRRFGPEAAAGDAPCGAQGWHSSGREARLPCGGLGAGGSPGATSALPTFCASRAAVCPTGIGLGSPANCVLGRQLAGQGGGGGGLSKSWP
eukprot:12981093-Alexandrium_andersonii.AAC.1